MDNALKQNINDYFSYRGFWAKTLTDDDVHEMQDFIWESVDYYEELLGRVPRDDEARRLFSTEATYPSGEKLLLKKHFLIGVYSEQSELVSILDVLQWEEFPEDFDVRLFLISPDYREQGLGSIFYNGLLNFLKDQNARTIYFKIRVHNEVGNKFLLDRGFILHYTGVEQNAAGGASLYVIMKNILKRSLYVK